MLKYFLAALLSIFLIGCKTSNIKTYKNKIEFVSEHEQKVLYKKAKAEDVPPEYLKITFLDSLIAENNLNIELLKKLNQYNKSFIPVAEKEIVKTKEFAASLSARLSEAKQTRAKLEELRKEITALNKRLDAKLIKLKKEKIANARPKHSQKS
jgi:hypothetical protein